MTQDLRSTTQSMDKLVAELAAKYPQAGLSFGYLGNYSRRWGDDRSWSVFTKISSANVHSNSVYWGSFSTEDLPRMLEQAQTHLEPWLVQMLQRARMLELAT